MATGARKEFAWSCCLFVPSYGRGPPYNLLGISYFNNVTNPQAVAVWP